MEAKKHLCVLPDYDSQNLLLTQAHKIMGTKIGVIQSPRTHGALGKGKRKII